MESRTEMLARHARELDELDSRWWEECFTEDPIENWSAVRRNDQYTMDWIKNNLPTIIRKREKIGVNIQRDSAVDGIAPVMAMVYFGDESHRVHYKLANKLAGRTLAPGEKVTI